MAARIWLGIDAAGRPLVGAAACCLAEQRRNVTRGWAEHACAAEVWDQRLRAWRWFLTTINEARRQRARQVRRFHVA